MVENRKFHVIRPLHNKLKAAKTQFLKEDQLLQEALSTMAATGIDAAGWLAKWESMFSIDV